MAPAVSIAATVAACTRNGFDYELITGKPAPEAKNAAARLAYHSQRDMILCEDDFLADENIWKEVKENGHEVLVGSAIMRNGQLNCYYHGDRLVLSGTVFVKIPWQVLDKIGDPWFLPRNLNFKDGEWTDNGENENGWHSDTWFYYRCWESGIRPRVIGNVTHLMHPANYKLTELNRPDDIHPLGMMSCNKLVG